MAEGADKKAVKIASAYGSLTRALTERTNAERIRIAQANFDVERKQVTAQKDQRASELAGIFQNHVGTVQANAAYRGVGGGSVAAIVGATSAEAEVARRNIDINANNAIGAAAAQAMVPIDDPVLSQLQGTFQGLDIGSNFVESLASLPSQHTSTTYWVNTSLGHQAVRINQETPGTFNLRDQFPELDAFLREGR